MTYPELYEVLEGEAHYLLQTVAGGVTASDPPGTAAPGGVAPQTLPSTGPPPLPGRIKDVVLVRAKAGDKVLIPPGYGHVTINPSRKVLRMANLVADGFHSLYEPYRRAGGAAYYETSDGKFAPNPRPAPPPPLREAKPAREVARGGEIYGWLRKAPDELAFLTEPRKFGDLWGRVLR
jgi:glucose-6-phosphate isomerase